ncbi:MAG: hypothetical protein LBJ00_03055 [Planctomycetaceae bacterium]|nr:hypothetical protein [Planctomycetaceae bacterium]
MKTNFRVVLLLLSVVTTMVSCVAFVLRPANEQSVIARKELGVLSWDVMTEIRGGGESGGCITTTTDCNGGTGVVSTECIGEEVETSTQRIVLQYYGGNYNTPIGTNNPTSVLAPKEMSTPDCFKRYSCVTDLIYPNMNCFLTGCDEPAEGDTNITGCTLLGCDEGNIYLASEGTCIDP